MIPFLRRGPGRLGPDEALQRASGGAAVPLDVRETPERRAGHPPRVRHLPLPRLQAEAGLPPSARGGPVVTIRRSRQATEPPAGRGVEEAPEGNGRTAVRARQGPPVTGEGGSGGVIP
ncbi:rhodanese-like domain-containing protein [Streptomyces luteogriseus]|uniref:rhodanese-like domain-containing protein n=1 Tax=Streptomyces luteogriseus TaxID=68233 RepID=UPI0037FF2B6F